MWKRLPSANATRVQFYFGSTLQQLFKRMGANLKQNNHTKIGNILKSVSHGLIQVYLINKRTNFHELAKKAEKHELPMIAIKLNTNIQWSINQIPREYKKGYVKHAIGMYDASYSILERTYKAALKAEPN